MRMKRFWYIVSVLLVSLLLVGGMLVAVLSSSEVETAAVRLVTAEFSRAFGTHARVGSITYRFPARVSIEDVYIEDRQGDTLLYAGELYAHFSPLALRKGEIRFSHARLRDVRAELYLLSDSTWNYSFIASAFGSEEEQERNPFAGILTVRDVQLESIRVRYDQFELALDHAGMDLHHLSMSSIDAQISDLSAGVTRNDVDAPAFRVESLSAHVQACDSLFVVPTLRGYLPNSRLDLSGIEIRSADSTMTLTFHEAELTPSDIALFVPQLSGLNRAISLNGSLTGKKDSLYFDNIVIRYNGRTVLEGSIAAFGLSDIENPYLRANLKDVQTSAPQLQDFLSQLYGRPFQLPAEVHRLGTIHYRGLAEGHLHDLTLHGAFRTALGPISTDGTFRSDSLFEHMQYDARVVARSFQLGRLLAQPQFGSVTIDVSSRGQIDEGQVSGDVKAYLRSFTYNGYTFNDVHINGRYDPKRYRGKFDIDDPHVDLSFDGVVDLHDVNPEVNFNLLCRHFDTEPLQFGSPIRTSFSMAVDLNGKSTDDVSGYMVIDSLFLATVRDSIRMQQLMLLVDAKPSLKKELTLRSDYVTAHADGTFRYADVAPALQALLHYYLPSAVGAPTGSWQAVSLDLEADGQRLRDVQRLFVAPLILSDHPSLTARLDISPRMQEGVREPNVELQFFAPGIRAANTPIHDLTVTVNNRARIENRVSPLQMTVSAEAMSVKTTVTTHAYHDTLLTHIVLDTTYFAPIEKTSEHEGLLERRDRLISQHRAGKYGGELSLLAHFERYCGRPLIELDVLPGTLLLRDSVYTLAEASLVYCAADTSLAVHHFDFTGAGQHLRANGLASTRAKDTLELDMQRLDASYIVPFLLPEKTIKFNGLLTGRANVTSMFRRPQFDTHIHIDDMGLNDCRFGDAEVDLNIQDSLAFHADVYRGTWPSDKQTVVDLNGKALFDGTGTWCLDMRTFAVPLEFINHWTSTVLHDLDGKGTGTVVVGGQKGSVYVLVRAEAKNASFTLPWTGARYTIPADTIVLDTTAIRFPNVHAVDVEGNPVEVNGEITHHQFNDFWLNLHVDAHDALVFDNNRAGDMIQGHVYADGHVDVTGPDQDILVYAIARTARHSMFRLSLDNASSAYESSFVHFVESPDSVTIAAEREKKETDLDNIDSPAKDKNSAKDDPSYIPPSRCQVKLNLDLDPNLQFNLVLGERNGDIIQGYGTGNLRLSYETPSDDVSLFGTYRLTKGTLNYTVANVIRKEFTIGDGSVIVFTGNPSNPQLKVQAKYRATGNLRDLLGDEAEQLGTSRSNIPVLTVLNMTGTLNNPILSFDLELPMSDQNIEQQVRQVINTDEMLMRQVIYLLVFNRFFTPDYMTNAKAATLNSTYSLLSSTVTGQINAWLSKLTTMLTLGVAIRTDGEGANSSQEYEAQFQLQPVDRLIINGNVGYRYNDMVSNRPFFGDLDVEVLLTDDGQLRFKGYTHTVDKYSLRQASTIQGVGLLWKKDFNWPEKKKKSTK